MRALGAVLTLSVVALLAGCGGGDTTTVVKNQTVTQTASTDTTTPTVSTPTTTGGDTTSSEAPTSFVHLADFQSPTGNIACAIIDGTARCDIVQRDWSPPARPASCPSEVDFGQGLQVGSGSGSFVCAGDTTQNPSAPKLAYGTASEKENFSCVSRESGITCTNTSSGHGFFISRQSYRVF